MNDIVVVGAGGLGREAMDVVKAENKWNILGFIDDNKKGMVINGFPVLGGVEWFEENDACCVIAIGNPKGRKKVVDELPDDTKFCRVIHPSAIISDSAIMGEDVVVCARCVITSNARIGNHVYLNIGCIVAHNDIIDDYCIIGPLAKLMGYNYVSEGVYVGVGACFIHGDGKTEGHYLKVGEWSIIGAGAVVLHDVPSYVTVAGVPAKIIKREKK